MAEERNGFSKAAAIKLGGFPECHNIRAGILFYPLLYSQCLEQCSECSRYLIDIYLMNESPSNLNITQEHKNKKWKIKQNGKRTASGSIFFLIEVYSTVYMYYIFFIHSFDRHCGCSHILATVKNVAINTGLHISF